MPTGGASCSVILTSLEVLQACEKQNSENGIAYSLHFALLYQYARQKVWRSFSVLMEVEETGYESRQTSKLKTMVL